MLSQSMRLDSVYIESIGMIVSKKEHEGPLGKYFKNHIDNFYFDCKTFEKAQSKLSTYAISQAIKKSKYKLNQIEMGIGGDLSNQIFATTSSLAPHTFPVIGVYCACASGIMSIILASSYLKLNLIKNALCVTSSHQCVSEKQFRYPNEYGVQLAESSTSTVTGGCCVIVDSNRHPIKVSAFTIGKIVDIRSKNVNDMGTAMAYAAVDTFISHMQNFSESEADYDLIVTGDLSRVGSKVFIDELDSLGFNISHKHVDCGTLIYDNKTQDVKSGGSGSACVMCVTFSYIVNKMNLGVYKKVLVIGTGALHSQISYQQKETIPCIAHGIVLEVNNDTN